MALHGVGVGADNLYGEHELDGIGGAQCDDVGHGARVAPGTGLRRVRDGRREEAEEGVLGVADGGGGKVDRALRSMRMGGCH